MKRWLVLVGFVFFAPLCFGQSVATLRGHVTDASGGAVANARLKLTLVATGAVREAVSGVDGGYEFSQLQPGKYNLDVDAQGFQSRRRENLDLLVATTSTVDVTLSVTSVKQEIVVTIDSGIAVNTTDATIGNAFDEKQVSSLPIEGRNVVELLSLQPGVTFLGKSTGNNDGDSRSGSVNGARSDQSNVTLDGIDVNDQNKGYAFNSVLRMTQDAVQEFRVTTSNPNADGGRGSGAQVALVTKSGTNFFHGSLYEYNRNAAFTANDYFNKRTQLDSGLPNKQPQLIRNVFGGAVGGPIKKDKIFFFLNYEGRRDAEAEEQTRTVPGDAMRQGIVKYYDNSGNIVVLQPADIQNMDPLHVGVNAPMQQVLNSFPEPNVSVGVGDGLNTFGYRFASTLHRSYNTYIARFDWNLTKNQSLFWRGNLMGDKEPGAPQFPGQPASGTGLTNSRGLALGYTALLKPTLISNFRWGFTRQSGSNSGISNEPSVGLQGLDSPVSFSRTRNFRIPVNNFVEDLAWTHGTHTFSFGTNIRVIHDARLSNANSFPDALINTGWLGPSSSVAGTGQPLDPAASGYPVVADGSNPQGNDFRYSYDSAIMDVVGVVTEGDAIYNYDRNGNPLALGTPVQREYHWNEFDWYGQDSWRLRKNLTVTLGLKYSYLQVPSEINGLQVSPCLLSGSTCAPYALTDYFNASAQQGLNGGSASNVPGLSFDLSGRANGKPDFWTPGKKDFSPRVAIAWSPGFDHGLLSALFGSGGKSSIRAGYGLVFDHFGAAIVNTFDTSGSFGLSSNISNPAGTPTTTTSPRFEGISTIPAGLLPSPPAGGFPASPDPNQFNISWGIDNKVKTPYSHLIDFSVSREITPSTSIEVAYIGRLAHRLLVQQDVAMPLDLRSNGVDYFAAAAALSKLAYAGTDVANVQNMPYWQTVFSALDNVDIGYGTLSATQNVYELISGNLGNETYALYQLDRPDSTTGAGINAGSHTYPSYRFYHSQYSALYAWRSIGKSYYDAMQIVLHHRFNRAIQADLNYTYSKSQDWTSQAERLATSGGNNLAQIINTWQPDQLKGVSDFDMTHQVNANYIAELPFGKGRRFLGNSGRALNALFGGWELTGIVRWTSGLPFMVDNGSRWPTNWDIEGFATQFQQIPNAALKRGSGPQMFADPQAVYNSFRYALPGESGTRNPLRGNGYYSWDTGLDKTFNFTERAHLQFRWEVFNVTNSVRFDPHSVSATLDSQTNFGLASNTLTDKRVMQIALRLEF
ncbi:MAG: carboxypeptidase regulatory-like domain-containing protein [Acidobacteria bacterium]|nr:carboxypeptidase regulatory-like domain-containing protein [Acidobacteriota bacterium]MBS1865742.1 carboxypeptidase regulatory-like domain-containing protein [Acidobacteriota bacterium]